jgi:hypothetical protein
VRAVVLDHPDGVRERDATREAPLNVPNGAR